MMKPMVIIVPGDMNDVGIHCSWGSRLDDSRYSWVNGRPDQFKNMKLACDDCVEKLEADKVIELTLRV